MPNYKELYRKLKTHLDKTTGQEVLEQEFIDYMERAGGSRAARQNLSERDIRINGIILNQLVTNQKAAKDLADQIPFAKKAKSEYMKQLERDAETFARADAKKKEAAEINERRKAARKELERIRQERIKNAAKEENRVATKEELAKPKTYDEKTTNWARRRNPLVGWMNSSALGTREERRGLLPNGAKNPEKHYDGKKNVIPVTRMSDDKRIKLNGGMFVPKNSTNPPKYALVFSGSRGTGAEYIDSIKDAYLEKGITVVQLDYRGFGTSTNVDEKGNPISNSPSERTMYEDGMEMYKFLNEELGVSPENITLHGYSLGGAVASRVALEVTKNLENRRIMENEPYDPAKGLGGVVLHSPMKSMYYAAKQDYTAVGGFFGWAFGGGYNTEEHMLELAKVDKNIPVHMIGGVADKDSNDFDWLSPEATGLEASLRGKFNNYTTYHGEGDHMGKTYLGKQTDELGNLVKNEKGETIDMFDPKPNVTSADEGLSRLVNQGRGVNLERNVMRQAAGGPQVE